MAKGKKKAETKPAQYIKQCVGKMKEYLETPTASWKNIVHSFEAMIEYVPEKYNDELEGQLKDLKSCVKKHCFHPEDDIRPLMNSFWNIGLKIKMPRKRIEGYSKKIVLSHLRRSKVKYLSLKKFQRVSRIIGA